MTFATISDRLISVINELETDGSLEAKVSQLARSEIQRRLARYQLVDRMMCAKYGMSLKEFEDQGIVEKLGYTFEVESDHQDWDLAVDGIATMEERLITLQGKA